ncbi:hypothetical protein CsSME_00032517 [Camellia sinensis var. sinensis]
MTIGHVGLRPQFPGGPMYFKPRQHHLPLQPLLLLHNRQLVVASVICNHFFKLKGPTSKEKDSATWSCRPLHQNHPRTHSGRCSRPCESCLLPIPPEYQNSTSASFLFCIFELTALLKVQNTGGSSLESPLLLSMCAFDKCIPHEKLPESLALSNLSLPLRIVLKSFLQQCFALVRRLLEDFSVTKLKESSLQLTSCGFFAFGPSHACEGILNLALGL